MHVVSRGSGMVSADDPAMLTMGPLKIKYLQLKMFSSFFPPVLNLMLF